MSFQDCGTGAKETPPWHFLREKLHVLWHVRKSLVLYRQVASRLCVPRFFRRERASERAEGGFFVRGHQHPPSPRHPLYGFLRMHARFFRLRLKISNMQVMCAWRRWRRYRHGCTYWSTFGASNAARTHTQRRLREGRSGIRVPGIRGKGCCDSAVRCDLCWGSGKWWCAPPKCRKKNAPGVRGKGRRTKEPNAKGALQG